MIGINRPPHEVAIEGADVVAIDLASDKSVTGAMEEFRRLAGDRIASVIHLAAYYDTTGEDNPLYEKVTVQGMLRLLDQLKTFGIERPGAEAPAQASSEPRW